MKWPVILVLNFAKCQIRRLLVPKASNSINEYQSPNFLQFSECKYALDK